MLHLSLVFLAHIQIRLHTGSANDGCRTKFTVDRIVGLIQFPGLIPVLIREQRHLRCFFPGDVGHGDTNQTQRSATIPEFVEELLADLIDLFGNVCAIQQRSLMGMCLKVIGTNRHCNTECLCAVCPGSGSNTVREGQDMTLVSISPMWWIR